MSVTVYHCHFSFIRIELRIKVFGISLFKHPSLPSTPVQECLTPGTMTTRPKYPYCHPKHQQNICRGLRVRRSCLPTSTAHLASHRHRLVRVPIRIHRSRQDDRSLTGPHRPSGTRKTHRHRSRSATVLTALRRTDCPCSPLNLGMSGSPLGSCETTMPVPTKRIVSKARRFPAHTIWEGSARSIKCVACVQLVRALTPTSVNTVADWRAKPVMWLSLLTRHASPTSHM